MTRLTGIRILALSVALWAIAVWLLGTHLPAGKETAAEPAAPAEKTAQREEAGAVAVAAAGTGAGADVAGEDPPLRTGAMDTSEADVTGIALPASGATAAATTPGTGTAGVPSATGTIGAVGVPATAPDAGDAGAERPSASTGDVSAPPVPPRPDAQHALPIPRPLPPTGSPAPPPDETLVLAGENAVASQLHAARRAAWEGRSEDALTHYRAAARIQPRSHVIWGEMGNVLWAMRRWPEAAYALEGAATLLVDAGELRAASDLLPAVGQLDPEAAHRVQRRLWIASQPPSG